MLTVNFQTVTINENQVGEVKCLFLNLQMKWLTQNC